MSIFHRLNGTLGKKSKSEAMSDFLKEQGVDLSNSIRARFLRAFEAETRGQWSQAESGYKAVLRSVKSQVVEQRLQIVHRNKE